MISQRISRINDVLYHIHKDISRDLPAKELAEVAAYSEHHFHRVFKEVVGEPLHQYIRRTKMEYAANQLMFDPHSSVLEVASKCGFNSVSSFSRAFKSTFDVSPGAWRTRDLQTENKHYLTDPEVAAGYHRVAQHVLPTPKILDVPERFVAYIRHTGYNRSIKNAWRVLSAWAKSEGRDDQLQFGLHHSNPAWVALEQCRYVACIEIDQPIKVRGVVNQLMIPGGLHAVFHLTGIYGELLPQISKILEQWLPHSGFKLGSTPAYVHYQKNHFLNDNEQFELDFYLPIGFY
ncbi:AraC family transcriptional regulator [Enterovibrio nigricans]|uniref:Transcriptional regulator, AraC family n=1 Tax=Enterovibrio nigricans DSM 22720 TaxID=1121868 RepID=A0A1T4VPD8_9GAMM|nr:GyrI-like domain-containing protein [Enterovibrio nigricans]SKA66816.1 transcriptional regulator, AraC family [Enterovibrio nigricans DSM 22720]